MGYEGKGNIRERWINYRDGYCKKLFVDRSPWYPLNSVMHQGLICGNYMSGDELRETGSSFKNDVRAYFANGSSLQ